jgi:hypothetical protein
MGGSVEPPGTGGEAAAEAADEERHGGIDRGRLRFVLSGYHLVVWQRGGC